MNWTDSFRKWAGVLTKKKKYDPKVRCTTFHKAQLCLATTTMITRGTRCRNPPLVQLINKD